MEGRRVVLVFTDGEDTASRVGFKTVLERARRRSDGLLDRAGVEYHRRHARVRSRPSRDLRKISMKPAAATSSCRRPTSSAPTFTRVAAELRSQCPIGFAPVALDKVLQAPE